VNNDNHAGPEDHVYNKTYILTPEPDNTPTPTVTDGGVLNAASFANDGKVGLPVAPGSLVTIFGSNFGTAASAAPVECRFRPVSAA